MLKSYWWGGWGGWWGSDPSMENSILFFSLFLKASLTLGLVLTLTLSFGPELDNIINALIFGIYLFSFNERIQIGRADGYFNSKKEHFGKLNLFKSTTAVSCTNNQDN